MKRGIWCISLLLMIALSVSFASAVNTKRPWHSLQQVAKTLSDRSNVDNNTNGIIDYAENLTSPGGYSYVNNVLVIKDSIISSGGDPRGAHATDLQTSRTTSTMVASGDNSVIVGGINNAAPGSSSVVVGGASNEASGTESFIGGGLLNKATDIYNIVLGGRNNQALRGFSAVLGGAFNGAYGDFSVVLGGDSNLIEGKNSLAYGKHLHVTGNRTIAFGYHNNPVSLEVNKNDTVYFHNLSVGINTSTPSFTLDVDGKVRINNSVKGSSTSATLQVESNFPSGGPTINIKNRDVNGHAAIDFREAGTNLCVGNIGWRPDWDAFVINDLHPKNVVMCTAATSNVGIGIITPATKLDVAGAIHATGDICTDMGGACLSIVAAGSSKWAISGSDIYRLSKVGINTNAPISSLHVESNFAGGGPTISMRNKDSNGHTAINFYDSTNTVVGNIAWRPDWDAFIINDQWPKDVVISTDAASNVGIGLQNPAEKLHVGGKIRASGDICTDLSGGVCLSTVSAPGTGLGAWAAAGTYSPNTDYVAATDGFVTAYKHQIAGGGNGPTLSAIINGVSRGWSATANLMTTAYIMFPVSSGDTWRVTDGGSNCQPTVINWIPLNGVAAGAALWSENGANIYRNSNVGIGTNNPTTALQVAGTARVDDLMIDNQKVMDAIGSDIVVGDLIGLDGQMNLRLRAGDQDMVMVTTTGRVGVGTNTPGATLDVSGDMVISGNHPLTRIATNSLVHGGCGSWTDNINVGFTIVGAFAAPLQDKWTNGWRNGEVTGVTWSGTTLTINTQIAGSDCGATNTMVVSWIAFGY